MAQFFYCRTITNPISIARSSRILEDAVQTRMTLHLCHATRLFPDLFSSSPSHCSPTLPIGWLLHPTIGAATQIPPGRHSFTIIRSLCHSLSRHSMEAPCNIFRTLIRTFLSTSTSRSSSSSKNSLSFRPLPPVFQILLRSLYMFLTASTRTFTPENVQFSPDNSAILPTRS